MGAQVFFFDHPQTEYPAFDEETVRVYFKENDEKPFLRCHISRILEVPNDVVIERLCGRFYPSNAWFFKISEDWRS